MQLLGKTVLNADFHNVVFLYPLKTCFKGVWICNIENKWIKMRAKSYEKYLWRSSFFSKSQRMYLDLYLAISWRRSLLCTSQFIDLLCKSIDRFLHDTDLYHGGVKKLCCRYFSWMLSVFMKELVLMEF